ncbi:MAG: pyridoxamine 5'-phosphate oxidase family protein [bacterium]|nr:pyridoxamine 5'-phosphate oxidase family protein [bacterium]
MNRFQQTFGEPMEMVRKKIFYALDPMMQDFIRQSPFVVLATAGPSGECDASPRGGMPGFVKVLDDKHLLLPDIAGNRLFHSYENVDGNAHAGLVFLIPGCDWTVRVNGRARVIDRGSGRLEGIAPEVFSEDENTKIVQALMIEVVETYAHCPRAFLFSKLWDTEKIGEAREADANLYWMNRWRESMAGR